MSESLEQDLSGISETLLLTLYRRAMESQRPDTLIKDEKAVALVRKISDDGLYDFGRMRPLHLSEANKLVIILRNREFDSTTFSSERRRNDKIVGRQLMTGKRMFLAGLAAGATGGLLVGQLKARPRRMPSLDVGQQVLAETRRPVQAAVLAARVQARYDELYAHRLHFDQPALRQHYEESILPGLALYQTLQEESDDQEVALAEIDRIFATLVERSGRRQLVRLMGRLPDPFVVLRVLNGWALKNRYPPEGWRFEWVEDSDHCVAYDALECFYLYVLTELGAPELTAHFCAVDDLLYGDLPGISWERTQTLGRGDDRCNFRFCRTNGSDGCATPRLDALAVYVCPACRGHLERIENTLRCGACKVTYPMADGIPDFLLEDREQGLGTMSRAMVRSIVRLYETPLWYAPILKLAGGKEAPSYGEVIRQMVGLMDVREGVLLDVACGPGTWGRRLASPAIEVYGIDISWSMLRQGVRAANDRHVDAIHFAHARVEALPFHDGRFDAAYCGGALHGFPDTIGSLREIGRTLKPGAPLVVLTFLDRDQPFVRMRRRAEARNDKLLKLHMFEVAELEKALALAGFDDFEPLVYGGVIIFRVRKRTEHRGTGEKSSTYDTVVVDKASGKVVERKIGKAGTVALKG